MLSKGAKSGSDLFQSLVNLRGRVSPSELHCTVLPQPKKHWERQSIWQCDGLCPIINFYLKSLKLYIFHQTHPLNTLYALQGKLPGKGIFHIILRDISSY